MHLTGQRLESCSPQNGYHFGPNETASLSQAGQPYSVLGAPIFSKVKCWMETATANVLVPDPSKA